MKTFVQITLATILATTSMMTLAEPAATNDAPSQASTTTMKHEAMTITLTDKHFTPSDKAETADAQQLTQNRDTESVSKPAI